MSTAVAELWGTDFFIENVEESPFAANEPKDDSDLKWQLILHTPSEVFQSVSKGASDTDVALDSPVWLSSRLIALRNRRFAREHNPRRRHAN